MRWNIKVILIPLRISWNNFTLGRFYSPRLPRNWRNKSKFPTIPTKSRNKPKRTSMRIRPWKKAKAPPRCKRTRSVHRAATPQTKASKENFPFNWLASRKNRKKLKTSSPSFKNCRWISTFSPIPQKLAPTKTFRFRFPLRTLALTIPKLSKSKRILFSSHNQI